jgi:acyl transferase domain-containing protein
MHLTQVNPQVPGASDPVPKQLLSQWHLPRVGSALPQAASQAPICGTSAFAFQGTNAHIIQEQGPSIGKLDRQTLALPLAWQRQRHWMAPPVSALIIGAISDTALALGTRGGHSRSGVVVMEVDLTSSRAAFLREYSLMQHTVFPAAGFVELCSSAAAMLSADKDVSGKNLLHLLKHEHGLAWH